MFIVFSGISSSGKNTIMKQLVERRKTLRVLEHSSGTTREPRISDSDFNTYVFMSEDEFKEGIKQGKFFEYEIVHGHYYGLILEKLKLVAEDEDFDYIRDVEVKGNLSLKKFFGDNMISIFIDAPDEVLKERLINRGEKPEEIELRMSRSELERSYKKNYDFVIENVDLENSVNEILKFLDGVKAAKAHKK